MTSDDFKTHVDHLDTGLPDRPDLAGYRRAGRAARRRRRAGWGLGAGALAAAVLTPVLVSAGGPSAPDAEVRVAADPAPPATSATPTPAPGGRTIGPGPVARDFGDGMRAATAEVFPEARFDGESFFDHYTPIENGVRDPGLESPPDWANIFNWGQHYRVEGLQYFDVRSVWDDAGRPMLWCAEQSFAIEKSCRVVEEDGYTIVVHDGVRLDGEPAGDWSRQVEVVSPLNTATNGSLVSEVLAQVEGMTWAEAATVLPDTDRMVELARDERLRLPEPARIPPVF